MPRSGYRQDKGRNFIHTDKPLKMSGSSWVEPQSAIVIMEDFTADVAANLHQVKVVQTGVPVTAFVISATGGGVPAGVGGWLAGATQAVDAEIDEIAIGPKVATAAGPGYLFPSRAGNGMLVVEWGFVIPVALTARQYFVGLSDTPSRGTAKNGPLNITGTYVVVADDTDAAGFVFSSLATAPTVWKYAAVLNTAVSIASAQTEGVTAVVDRYTVCRVEVDSLGNAYFLQSIAADALVTGVRRDPNPVGGLALAVTPTNPLLPKFTAAPTTTTSVEWEIDYCFAATAR